MRKKGAVMANIKEALAGVANYDAAVERFMGSEAMYTRFLSKFVDDENYGKFVSALDAGDAKAAFEAAHTLKGTSATLELTGVAQAVDPVVESLRTGDVESARAAFLPLEAAYNQAIETLRAL